MALAGVTGGELRITDTIPHDLRMICLVFDQLGLHSEFRRQRHHCARQPAIGRPVRFGGYKRKVMDGPWPAFPADLTSIAVALATQAEGSVLIHEWMFESRLVFTDKLAAMGADIVPCDPHRAIVTGPQPAARRAIGVARHPRRYGDADRRAVRRGAQRDRQRRADRSGYERIDERLRSPGRADRTPVDHPHEPIRGGRA